MLICDKRRPRTRGDTNIRPPQGGRIKTAPPASGPRLGRSSAWGGTPPDPLGCAPWCAFAHRAPAASVTQPEGSGHGCARWPGWSTACGCPRWTPSPWRFSGFGRNSKGGPCGCTAGGSGGRAPRCSGAVGNACAGGGRSGVNAQRCPRRPRAAALSTAERAMGNSGLNNLIGQTFLVLHNQPAQSRASIGFQENHCIKK